MSPFFFNVKSAEIRKVWTETTVYRILTEAKNVAEVERMLIRLGLDYTVLRADGSYQGKQEKSLVLELVNAPRELVFMAAKRIKNMNAQDAVLVQEIPVVSEMV